LLAAKPAFKHPFFGYLLGNFLLVVHGKEEKKRKEKVSRSCGGVLKEDRRVLRMHAFVFLLKLHNKSLY